MTVASSLLWIAFISGLATSLGPCLAPRYLALVTQISNGANGLSIGSFLAGCIAGYVAFAAGGALVTVFQTASPQVYAFAGVLLAATGIRYLLAPGQIRHRHLGGTGKSLGARFLGGLCSSLFGAPCCAPIALALGAQSAAYDAGFGAVTLAAFGIGQTVPLAALATAMRFRRVPCEQTGLVPSTVGGTLLVAMGALYGAMA